MSRTPSMPLLMSPLMSSMPSPMPTPRTPSMPTSIIPPMPLNFVMPPLISSLCNITFLNTDPCICPIDFERKPYSRPGGPTNEMKCVRKPPAANTPVVRVQST